MRPQVLENAKVPPSHLLFLCCHASQVIEKAKDAPPDAFLSSAVMRP